MPFVPRVISLLIYVVAAALLPARAEASGLSLSPMLQRVLPSVVSISVQGKEQDDMDAMLADPFYRKFFGLPDSLAPTERNFQVAGSGVIIDAQHGYIVTNQHVVLDANKIEVALADGRHYEAELVGTDVETDVAVLQIPPTTLIQAKFGTASSLEVGDVVVAIGNPFGLAQTATMGIVSALGREGLGTQGYENFIQTDASINPGNSGGALVNEDGLVVGINSAIIGPAGGSVGIGFAVPAETVEAVMRQLILHGKIIRGELGVTAQDLTRSLAIAFNVDAGPGALVNEVRPGSPAEAAGIRPGDTIRSLNGTIVRSASDLHKVVGTLPVGSRALVEIDRAGERGKDILILIAAASPDEQTAPQTVRIERGPFAGVEIEDNPERHGVRVVVVTDDTTAARAGLQPDDMIIALDRKPVSDIEGVVSLLAQEELRSLVTIRRSNHQFFMALDTQTQ